MQLVIGATGEVWCIYDEAIELDVLGRLHIARVSHVEPDANGRWWADLAPVHGPKLGPFRVRSEALEEERTWLETHWLACEVKRGCSLG